MNFACISFHDFLFVLSFWFGVAFFPPFCVLSPGFPEI